LENEKRAQIIQGKDVQDLHKITRMYSPSQPGDPEPGIFQELFCFPECKEPHVGTVENTGILVFPFVAKNEVADNSVLRTFGILIKI
jgi:hypothetical protein